MFEDDDEEYDEDNAIENTPQHSLAATPASDGPPTVAQRRFKGRIVSGSLQRTLAGHRLSVSRRFSTASGQLPAIFANTGVETPGVSLDESPTDPFFPSPAGDRRPGALSAIAERPAQGAPEVQQSTLKALPLLMISQVSVTTMPPLTAVWAPGLA